MRAFLWQQENSPPENGSVNATQPNALDGAYASSFSTKGEALAFERHTMDEGGLGLRWVKRQTVGLLKT